MSTDERLRAAYDPEHFRALGHRLIDQLADYLGEAERGVAPVLPPGGPEELLEHFPAEFPQKEGLERLLARVIAASNHLHHPCYVGHQVTAPLPEAALCDLVSALLNNGMAVFEMGPASTAMERSVIRFLAASLGFGAGADGVLTSGGSAGNLTALLAARQAKAGGPGGADTWSEGTSPTLSILGAEQAHYSVARSAQIMGLGARGFWPVPTDARFRLKTSELRSQKRAAEAAGRTVFAVVGSACSTAAGAFDPLEEIADFCEEHGLWFHVDGAHGAAAVLCERYRHLLRGASRADSLIWDAHKMMLMPALLTAVLFRDGARSYEPFAQEASYLFSSRDPRQEWFNLGGRTLECTKRMMSLKLYAALSVHGPRLFGDYVGAMFDLAKKLAARLSDAPDFELAVEPECNIVCFRHTPAGATDLDALQARLRQRVLAEGSFYLVQTRLRGALYLRTTIVNPLTREEDLAALLERLRALSE